MYKNITTITKEEIKNLNISAQEKIEWINCVLRDKDNYILPTKTKIPLNESDYFNVMPCVLPPEDILGLKVVTRNAFRREHGMGNIEGDILLYSYKDFEPKALIDGGDITTIRTAAVAVHSMLNFAPKDIFNQNEKCKIAIIGLGKIGNEIGNILFDFLKDKPFIVKLYKYKNQAESFINRFKHFSNIEFTICDTYEEVMKDSDVIFSAITYTENDFCKPEIYKRKCTIIPVHLRGFKECDCTFDQIITSDLESIKKFENYSQIKKLLYIDDIIKKDKHEFNGRTLIYNLGLAVYDLYFANKIYNKIQNHER